MKSIAVKAAVLAALVGAGLLALTTTASATHVEVEVVGPNALQVGQPAELQLALRSAEDGLPIANAPVTVYAHASFAGVSGDIVLGQAMTDESGVALVNFEPRAAGEHELRIEYLAPGDGEPEVAATTVSVNGAAQLYQSASGIQVPGLNVWLIIGVVAAVWFTLMSVALRVIAIARASAGGEPALEWAVRGAGAEARKTALEAGGTPGS